jgi:hypothetical protein
MGGKGHQYSRQQQQGSTASAWQDRSVHKGKFFERVIVRNSF